MSDKIFISYRRDDSAYAAVALYKQLIPHFGAGNIFMDVDTIKPGVDFVKVLEEAVGSCKALIVVIGTGWITAATEQGRRLDDPRDFVRLEVGSALKRDVRVIPVLINEARMPHPEQLPPDLRPLVRRNAIELSNTRFDADIDRLVHALKEVLAEGEPTPVAPAPPPRRRSIRVAGVLLTVAAAATALFLVYPRLSGTGPAAGSAGGGEAMEAGPPTSEPAGPDLAADEATTPEPSSPSPDPPPRAAVVRTEDLTATGPSAGERAAEIVRRFAILELEALSSTLLTAKLDSARVIFETSGLDADVRARAALVAGQMAFLVQGEDPDEWYRRACGLAPDPTAGVYGTICRGLRR